jgi:uncharacterized membrane protein YeaQ/YmgE (transglycosylase-associated protein family)
LADIFDGPVKTNRESAAVRGWRDTMNGVGLIGAIVIGILAGWIAEKLMNRRHGLLTNLVVGLIGALIGGFLAGALGFAWAGWLGSLVVSTIGAVILLFLLGLVRRP